MSIKTSVPASVRTPQRFHEFDYTSQSRGLVPVDRRLALVGAVLNPATWATSTAYTLGAWAIANGNLYRATVAGTSASSGSGPSHTTGTATDGTATWLYVSASPSVAVGVPTQMFTEADGDTAFGRGSELALMVRAAMAAAKKYKKQAQIFAIGIADPGGGARGTKTMTVSGSPTAAGDLVFRIAGRYLRAGINKSDSTSTVATAIKSAIDEQLEELPVTASVSSAVVTVLLNNAGANGAALVVEVVSLPPGLACAVAAGTTASGNYDITSTLDVLVDKQYHAIAVASHVANDISDAKTFADARTAPDVKKPPIIYFGETGTVSTATTLTIASNHWQIVLAACEQSPSLPCEIAAMVASVRAGEDFPNISFNGVEIPAYPPPASYAYTEGQGGEVETLLAAGATPLLANDAGDGLKIVRLVTTKTVHNGAPFYDVLDVAAPESMFYTAAQVDAAVAKVERANIDTETVKLIRGVVLGVLRKEERSGVLQNVEAHKGELVVEQDEVVVTRLNIGLPESVVPHLHQTAFVHTLYVETLAEAA